MTAGPNITTIREALTAMLTEAEGVAWGRLDEYLAIPRARLAALDAVERELADLRAENERHKADADDWHKRWRREYERSSDAERRLREATDALRKIAGPRDDLTMKGARTLHYDMAGWAAAALAAVEGTAAEAADDAEIASVVRERDASDDGTRLTLDEVLDDLGITREQVEGTAATPGEDDPCRWPRCQYPSVGCWTPFCPGPRDAVSEGRKPA